MKKHMWIKWDAKKATRFPDLHLDDLLEVLYNQKIYIGANCIPSKINKFQKVRDVDWLGLTNPLTSDRTLEVLSYRIVEEAE